VIGLLVNMSIGRKIVGLSVITLSLMLAAAIYAFIQTSRVHTFSAELVDTLEPLAHDIATIEGGTLKEALLVERSLRHAGPIVQDEAVGNQEFTRFQVLSRMVSARLDKAMAGVHDSAAKTNRAEIAVELARLETDLDTVRREHLRYDAAAAELFAAADGATAGTRALERNFSDEELRLAEALDRLAIRIDRLARREEQMLGSLENRAFLVSAENLAVAIFAFLAGTLLASLITRRMLRPVRNLIAGTEAVGRGELDVAFPAVGRDEIGKLTSAFQHMVGELRSKAAIRETFGSYVDRRVVDRLLSDGREAIEAGEKREMTVFFADMAGFSTISETLTPTALVRLINTYLSLVSEPIAAHQGVIDKYIGDAVMAFWGPPFTEGDFALHACRAALAQGAQLEALRVMLPELLGLRKGAPKIDVRIGLATGDVVVGSIGSKLSKSFTVMGDTVNIASRLEGANKFYGTSILVDATTQARVRNVIETREIDLLAVTGKDEPVHIFELLAVKGELDADRIAMRDAFEAGLARYRAQDWDRAESLFGEAQRIAPDDRPSGTFLDRVRLLRSSPPGDGWNAVWQSPGK